jgi:hypothetical protein
MGPDATAGGLAATPTAGPALVGPPEVSGFEDLRPYVSVVALEIGDTVLLVPSAIVVAEGTHTVRVRNEGTIDRDFLIEGVPTQRKTRISAGQGALVQLDGIQPGSLYSVVLSEASDATTPEGAAGGMVVQDPARATLIVLPGRRGPRSSLTP